MSVEDFEHLQEMLGDIPGQRGAELRREKYTPYFLRMGRDVFIAEGCRFTHPDGIVLEDDVRFNVGALVFGSGGVWVGRHARIGPRCFIHSANHEIGKSPLAFHERGYVEEAVRIGDNALISANVSILPGAVLGDDVFVACGAVVPKGHYPAGSRLFGVPAKSTAPPTEEPPEAVVEIALLTPRAGHWEALAQHLLSTLGLPQVGIAKEGDSLPASVHSAILFGPADWRPNVVGTVRVCIFDERTQGADHPEFQAQRLLRYAYAGRCEGSNNAGDEQLAQALFWLVTRLHKGAGRLPIVEFHEWVIALRFLQLDPKGNAALLGLLLAELFERHPVELRGLPPPTSDGTDPEHWLRLAEAQARAAVESRSGRIRTRVLNISGQIQQLWSAGIRMRELITRIEVLGRRDFRSITRSPSFALSRQLLAADGPAGCAANAAGRPPRQDRGHDLVATALSAHLSGNAAEFQRVDQLLSSEAWQVPGVAFPRSKQGSASVCYSPLVLAWLFVRRHRIEPDFRIPEGFGLAVERTEALVWHTLDNGQFHDLGLNRLSRSLVDNWATLHRADCPPGTQFVLEESAYKSDIRGLEQRWFTVFKDIQHAQGRPLLRAKPWPAGYSAALSIRYDVDRPVTPSRITELVRLQARYANAPCASWYYFTGHRDIDGHGKYMSRHWQERGIHAQEARDAHPGWGVTHHSAPTSDYWQGSATNSTLEENGATYGEFLASSFDTPRPALHLEGNDSGAARIWLTPLHFPLEGSTSDKTLAYFDTLLTHFRERLRNGGHAIIGSHPDLNQEILKELLQREHLNNVWIASIGEVVARCRKVMRYGSIRLTTRGGVPHVWSADGIADLQLEIWRPDTPEPTLRILQLKSLIPRPLDS
jgi:acetyltransferase-like isoleucine patch superfamily enzyme